MTDQPKLHEDPKIDKFLRDFNGKFPGHKGIYLGFRARWTLAQLEEYWFPMIRLMTMDELREMLDHYMFEYPDGSSPPDPGAFRRLWKSKRKARREVFSEGKTNVTKMPVSQENVDRLAALHRTLPGLHPMTEDERAKLLAGGGAAADEEDERSA